MFVRRLQVLVVLLITGSTFCCASNGYAQEYRLSEEMWVQVFSRTQVQDAASLAREMYDDWPYTRVFFSENGQYAVVIGKLRISDQVHLLDEWKSSGKIPEDSLLVYGSGYLADISFLDFEGSVDPQEKSVKKLGREKRELAPPSIQSQTVEVGRKYYRNLEVFPDDIFLRCEEVFQTSDLEYNGAEKYDNGERDTTLVINLNTRSFIYDVGQSGNLLRESINQVGQGILVLFDKELPSYTEDGVGLHFTLDRSTLSTRFLRTQVYESSEAFYQMKSYGDCTIFEYDGRNKL